MRADTHMHVLPYKTEGEPAQTSGEIAIYLRAHGTLGNRSERVLPETFEDNIVTDRSQRVQGQKHVGDYPSASTLGVITKPTRGKNRIERIRAALVPIRSTPTRYRYLRLRSRPPLSLG